MNGDHTASAQYLNSLLTDGYVVVPQAVPPATIEEIHADLQDAFERTPFGSGHFYGEATKRFGRLPLRSARTRDLILNPLVLGIVGEVLKPWCDTVQLNTTQAIAIHPGEREQLPHRDQDMWRLGPGHRECLVNVMWPLTAFNHFNGGTRIWPGSHGERATEEPPVTPPVVPELAPGSALMFLGSTLHAGGSNRSTTERRGVIIGYSLGWLKPYENPWLAYPPEVARTFPPDLARLAGYVQHRPNLGNFEGQCPSILLGDYRGEPLGAVDALRDDQAEAVRVWAQGRPT